MFVEIHLLQNFALSNLNRDDTGAPKSCVFGGARRARVSSQCLKRAVRTHFREEGLVPSELLSKRTKLLRQELINRLTTAGMELEKAGQVAEKTIEQVGVGLDKGKTKYLIMLGEREISRLAAIAHENADALLALGAGGKKAKKDGGDSALPQQLLDAVNGGDAVDMALFGRMIADQPAKNVDAAVQMAHAFSTHAVATEFDFYSAVDDLQKDESDEGAGAGMLGTTLYNSSCYYRYANVNLAQLEENLSSIDQVDLATRAFLEAMIHAVPTGKQTNSAPQNPPALVMVVVRNKGLWSLANAFVKPVRAGERDLIEQSAIELETLWNKLAKMYGSDSVRYTGAATYLPELKAAGVVNETSVPALLDRVMQEIRAARN